MKLRCIIVDDEPIARQIIAQFCVEDDRIEILAHCKNAIEAIPFLQKNTIDLVFLDINMPKLSGLEMLSTLHSKPMIIFTTAYREFAVEGFEQNAVDYLVKPIPFQRFLQAINRAFDRLNPPKLNTENSDFFFVKSEGKNVKILFADILFLEAQNEYIRVYTTTKSFLILYSLKKIEEQLPMDTFMKVHRSYIVAVKKIEAIEGNQIIISNNKIPVSKSHRSTLSHFISKFDLL